MASDAGCNQQLICAVALEKRDISTSPLAPFDPRTDVSADAKYVARARCQTSVDYLRRVAFRSDAALPNSYSFR